MTALRTYTLQPTVNTLKCLPFSSFGTIMIPTSSSPLHILASCCLGRSSSSLFPFGSSAYYSDSADDVSGSQFTLSACDELVGLFSVAAALGATSWVALGLAMLLTAMASALGSGLLELLPRLLLDALM